MAIIMVTLCQPRQCILDFEVAGLSSTATQRVFIITRNTMLTSAVVAGAARATVAAALAVIIIICVATLHQCLLLGVVELMLKSG